MGLLHLTKLLHALTVCDYVCKDLLIYMYQYLFVDMFNIFCCDIIIQSRFNRHQMQPTVCRYFLLFV